MAIPSLTSLDQLSQLSQLSQASVKVNVFDPTSSKGPAAGSFHVDPKLQQNLSRRAHGWLATNWYLTSFKDMLSHANERRYAQPIKIRVRRLADGASNDDSIRLEPAGVNMQYSIANQVLRHTHSSIPYYMHSPTHKWQVTYRMLESDDRTISVPITTTIQQVIGGNERPSGSGTSGASGADGSRPNPNADVRTAKSCLVPNTDPRSFLDLSNVMKTLSLEGKDATRYVNWLWDHYTETETATWMMHIELPTRHLVELIPLSDQKGSAWVGVIDGPNSPLELEDVLAFARTCPGVELGLGTPQTILTQHNRLKRRNASAQETQDAREARDAFSNG